MPRSLSILATNHVAMFLLPKFSSGALDIVKSVKILMNSDEKNALEVDEIITVEEAWETVLRTLDECDAETNQHAETNAAQTAQSVHATEVRLIVQGCDDPDHILAAVRSDGTTRGMLFSRPLFSGIEDLRLNELATTPRFKDCAETTAEGQVALQVVRCHDPDTRNASDSPSPREGNFLQRRQHHNERRPREGQERLSGSDWVDMSLLGCASGAFSLSLFPPAAPAAAASAGCLTGCAAGMCLAFNAKRGMRSRS